MVEFPIRHDQRVRLLNPIFDLKPGREGKVLAMRVNEEKEAEYLIKWTRRAWPTVALLKDLERI